MVLSFDQELPDKSAALMASGKVLKKSLSYIYGGLGRKVSHYFSENLYPVDFAGHFPAKKSPLIKKQRATGDEWLAHQIHSPPVTQAAGQSSLKLKLKTPCTLTGTLESVVGLHTHWRAA